MILSFNKTKVIFRWRLGLIISFAGSAGFSLSIVFFPNQSISWGVVMDSLPSESSSLLMTTIVLSAELQTSLSSSNLYCHLPTCPFLFRGPQIAFSAAPNSFPHSAPRCPPSNLLYTSTSKHQARTFGDLNVWHSPVFFFLNTWRTLKVYKEYYNGPPSTHYQL